MSTATATPERTTKPDKVEPVPRGMHTVTPHLVCAGAAEAIEFYKKAFGAEELFRLPGPSEKLMHAAIRIGDSKVMLVDESPDWGALGPVALKGTPVTIHLQVEDADAWFERAVKAGAKSVMGVAEMFWGDRYGVVKDPFGHQWSIATHVKDLTPEEIAAAAPNACGG
jgi:PhnB protein